MTLDAILTRMHAELAGAVMRLDMLAHRLDVARRTVLHWRDTLREDPRQ
jgi:hypothetical protein